MGTKTGLVTLPLGLAASLIWCAASSAAVYGGQTVAHDPIAITLAKNGQVKSIALDWTAPCTSGKSYTFGGVLTATKKMPSVVGTADNPLIGKMKKGRLSGTGLGSAALGDGVGGAISHKFAGKFKPGSASGTWSGHMDVVDAGGSKIDSCDTGTLRWAAMRGPNVYGGSTTQGEPVVVITKTDRSGVGYFGFGWRADCTPAGSDQWHISEEFGNFPMTGSGAFGDTFTNEFPYKDATGKNTFTYALDGTLGKTSGAGSVSVHVVEADAAGSPTSTCDTNSVKWSVRQ
ncbi:MAG TPA: hypothetical protein VF066_02510 [Thermoleophilaceae bacterium]